MAEPVSSAASIRAAIAAHGLTQKEVANFLGVSDRMVRQVLSGAKPGRNLAGAASQLARQGVVTTPPTRRAQKVRTGGKGAPTAPVLPTPKTRHSVGAAGRSQTAVDVPAKGLGREAARKAITDALGARRGGRKARGGKRVMFTVTTRDGRQMTIGRKGGYDPARVVDQMDVEGDPYAWLVDQLDSTGEYEVGGVGGIASVAMTFL